MSLTKRSQKMNLIRRKKMRIFRNKMVSSQENMCKEKTKI